VQDSYSAARAYVGIGWHIFAKRPRSKRPLAGSHDYLDARLDPSPWRRNPRLNIALACGPSNILVLDIDDGSLEQVASILGEAALATPQQRSGGGRWHLFYRAPDPGTIGMEIRKHGNLPDLPGCEVLGTTANVMLCPSIHPSGRMYRWNIGHNPWRIKLRPTPEPLIEMLKAKQQAAAVLYAPRFPSYPNYHRPRYGEKMLEGCIEELARTIEKRNTRLYLVSLRLGRAIAGGLLDERKVRLELEEAACGIGLEAGEIKHTINSGLKAGAARPLW